MHGAAIGQGIAGILFGIIWLFMMVAMMVAWIFMLVAIWRAMKAHESMAHTLSNIADNLRPKS